MASNPRITTQLLLLISILSTFELKAEAFLVQNPCAPKMNCHECIQTPSCAWCYQPEKEFGNYPRCYQPAGQHLHKPCPKEYEYFPSNYFYIVAQKPLSKPQTKNRKTRQATEWSSSSSSTFTSTSGGGDGTFTNTTTTYYSGGGGGGFSNFTTINYTSGDYNAGGQGGFNIDQYGGFNGGQYGSSSGQFGGGGGGLGQGGGSTSYSSSSGQFSGGFGQGGQFGGGGFGQEGGSTSTFYSGGGSGGGSATFVNTTSTVHTTTTTTTTVNTSEIIQITPQRVQMKLRARESYSFTVSYAQAQDYPVDLYYLMDLSKSMEDDKEKLSKLGNLLAQTMNSVTSEFQLGFGSFVDKVVMPYVSTVPSNLKHPCVNCSEPYGYFHAMQLSKRIEDFAEMVKSAKVSGNLDAPEGGFDAIMQAVVCKEQIGWRDNARRLLVFSTDDGFHYAGDGKLGGIIRPNDGLCHLDKGYYSYSSIQDYPSISQLNMKVKENAINVIFAVTEERIAVYDKLKTYIEGASSGVLSADSSNVVQFIRKQYEAISSKIELKDNATFGVEIKYYSRCRNPLSGVENNTSACGGFKVGEIIDFRLEVFLKECPEDPSKWRQTIQVYPVGLTESVFIDLEMLCSCPCEQPVDPTYKQNAKECNGFGTYMCGICDCDSLHHGRNCECALDTFTNKTGPNGCRDANSTETVDCSGKGACICNKCECDIPDNANERITGKFCECDNFSCYRHNSIICGGNGVCDCGKCKCNPPWTGDACACYNDTSTCYPPYKEDSKLCDGHGTCDCGQCICENTEKGRYTGRYCERCPNCTETCDELKPCVLCQMYHVKPYDDETCTTRCQNFTPIEVQVVQADEDHDEFPCAGYDEDDCRYVFVYKKYNATYYIVKAQKERECPPKVFLLGIVLGVIAAVVLMGLAILLMWKLLTTIHDRREFARFEKERMMAKWDTGENPIYKQATSTFKNPTYAGKG